VNGPPVIVDTDDINEISSQLERCNGELIQLGSGPLHLTALLLPLGFMHLAFARARCAVVLRGAVPEGVGLVLQTSPASVPLRVGAQLVGGEKCVFASSRSKQAIYLPENCSIYAFVAPSGSEDVAGRRRSEICVPAPEHAIAMRSSIALLTTSRKQLLAERGFGSELRRKFQELLLPVASTLWAYKSPPLPHTSGRVVRVCAVMRACSYIDTHLQEPLTLQHLCDAAGVRARTLEYGFHECYEVGPMTYLRSVRLGRVRRELSRAHSSSVAAIARRWCFTHMGQFGRDYRLHFGETPSVTLARARHGASQIA
jgi:AraC family transcriptional regulator, ethanolamine operon transcriptional activator